MEGVGLQYERENKDHVILLLKHITRIYKSTYIDH